MIILRFIACAALIALYGTGLYFFRRKLERLDEDHDKGEEVKNDDEIYTDVQSDDD